MKGKWYRKLIEDLQLSGHATRTVYGYTRAVRVLSNFCQVPPHRLTEEDQRRFLLHQIVDKKLAFGSQSVLLSGFKFFYKNTCPRDWQVL